MKRLLLIALICLAGCSTIKDTFTDYPKQVAVLQSSLATAEHTALIYVNLPVCGKTSALACRTPAITKKIGAYDEVAYNALKAARVAEDQTSLQAAMTAVDALHSVTDTLPVKGN